MSNGLSESSGPDLKVAAPWWIQFILRVGVLPAIAIGLVVFLATLVTRNLELVSANVNAINISLSGLRDNDRTMIDLEREFLGVMSAHEKTQSQTVTLLYAQCMNNAESDLQRQRCNVLNYTK